MSEPFSAISQALLAVFNSDSALSTLTRSMNIEEDDGGSVRQAGLNPADLPALRLGLPVDRQSITRTSRATRFHLRYPLTLTVERAQSCTRMNMLKWRVLLAIYQAGPTLGLEQVSRVSVGTWFKPEVTGRGRLVERLMIEVDVWVPHVDPVALGD